MKSWILFAALALPLGTAPALAQTRADVVAALEANFGAPERFEEAFAVIQAAIGEDDATTLSEFIPLGSPLMVEGEEVVFDDAEAFIERYDALITPQIRDVVANQSFDTLFVNAEGVMFGAGEVWMTGICLDDSCADFEVKIITLQSGL